MDEPLIRWLMTQATRNRRPSRPSSIAQPGTAWRPVVAWGPSTRSGPASSAPAARRARSASRRPWPTTPYRECGAPRPRPSADRHGGGEQWRRATLSEHKIGFGPIRNPSRCPLAMIFENPASASSVRHAVVPPESRFVTVCSAAARSSAEPLRIRWTKFTNHDFLEVDRHDRTLWLNDCASGWYYRPERFRGGPWVRKT